MKIELAICSLGVAFSSVIAGDYEFKAGYPTDATTTAAKNDSDFQRCYSLPVLVSDRFMRGDL